jgi:hypothetical protein
MGQELTNPATTSFDPNLTLLSLLAQMAFHYRRLDHGRQTPHPLSGHYSFVEETGIAPAPKEQPPRKLSGIKDRKTTDALESGQVLSGPPKRKKRCKPASLEGAQSFRYRDRGGSHWRTACA